MLYVKVSPSVSVPANVIALSLVSSATIRLCAVASGATFGSATSVTVIFTVAATELMVPSFTIKVKLSAPL